MLAALLGLALRDWQQKFGSKKLAGIFLAVALPTSLLLVASYAMHFRILGRHFAALWPVAVLLLGGGLAAAWRRGTGGKFLAFSFIGLYLASALSLRFAARHEKDDYRGAANFAKTALAQGKVVWWNADRNSAIFYQVPLVADNAPVSSALWLANPEPRAVTNAQPDVIIATRPDAYDERGGIRELARQRHYQPVTNVTAFQIWLRRETNFPVGQIK
jgi:hypothetical protein